MASSVKAHNGLAERLKAELEARGLSIRSFSDTCNIPYRTAQAYLRAESLPGAEALASIATGLHISLDWLVLGETSPGRHSDGDGVTDDRGPERSALEALWAAEGRALQEESDLGRRARLARLGRTRQAWVLLEVLAHQPSGGMTLAKLSEGVGSAPDETLSYLSLLVQAGLVAEIRDEDGGRFRLTSEFLELTFGEPADISQIGMESIRQILRVVVPATERKEGRLSVGVGRVQKGRSLELAQELIQFAKERCQATVSDLPEEEVVVVVGVAKASETVLPSPSNPEGAELS